MMELIQIDALQPQALQAAFNRAPQMVGATIRDQERGLGRTKPPFVAMTNSGGQGYSACEIINSLVSGP